MPTSADSQAATSGRFDIFQPPNIVRVLFDKFPLYRYPVDPLPATLEEGGWGFNNGPTQNQSQSVPILHARCHPSDLENGAPSFDPTCLKWQTYLKIKGINFNLGKSNEHASPSGKLPFLAVEPKRQPKGCCRVPRVSIPISKLPQWVEDNTPLSPSSPIDLEALDHRAFMSLLDTSVRTAWLYCSVLDESNKLVFLTTHYTDTVRAWPAKTMLEHQIVNTTTSLINEKVVSASKPTSDRIYSEAEEAWQALSTLLGPNDWFFSSSSPGLFDASVFSYTHLILRVVYPNDNIGGILSHSLRRHSNLVKHEQRMRSRFFPGV